MKNEELKGHLIIKNEEEKATGLGRTLLPFFCILGKEGKKI